LHSRAFNLKRSSALNWCLVLLCLLLVFSSALIQASHLHPNGPNHELKECPVCHLAAGTAQAALVVMLYFVIRATIFVAFAEDQEPKIFLGAFSLFSRPPPLA
jgi:putative exporter of polyketide antibiotics